MNNIDKAIQKRYNKIINEYADQSQTYYNNIQNIEKNINLSISNLTKISEELIKSNNDKYKNISINIQKFITSLDDLILNDYKESSLSNIKTQLKEIK